MEREGVKEEMARRARHMQHPIRYFMRGGCSEKIARIASKLETDTRTETVKVKMFVPDGGQMTTPKKRKCHSSMNPESTQHQSDVFSPAKKQRLNNLMIFGRGVK